MAITWSILRINAQIAKSDLLVLLVVVGIDEVDLVFDGFLDLVLVLIGVSEKESLHVLPQVVRFVYECDFVQSEVVHEVYD